MGNKVLTGLLLVRITVVITRQDCGITCWILRPRTGELGALQWVWPWFPFPGEVQSRDGGPDPITRYWDGDGTTKRRGGLVGTWASDSRLSNWKREGKSGVSGEREGRKGAERGSSGDPGFLGEAEGLVRVST